MVVTEQVDMLNLVARYATQVGTARTDADKIHELAKVINQADDRYRGLSNSLEYAFHHLTELLLEQGLEIPADNDLLNVVQESFERGSALRKTLIKGLHPAFKDLSDIIEYCW